MSMDSMIFNMLPIPEEEKKRLYEDLINGRLDKYDSARIKDNSRDKKETKDKHVKETDQEQDKKV